MKKILSIFIALFAVVILAACDEGPTLVLYNWGDYMDPELLREFRKETGIRVREFNFLDNETAITQMQSEYYDLVIPSDYAVEQLASMDLIEEIDWNQITSIEKHVDYPTNLNNLLSILSDDEDLPFDFTQWAVPYFWGSLGLLYNSEVAGLKEDVETLGWDVLNENYKISLYDNSRDGLVVGLKALGYSANTTNETEIKEAEAWLTNLKRNKGSANLSFVTDGILDHMRISGDERYDVSVVFSGDAVYLMELNENLNFITPHQGSNVWVDGMVIPKGGNQEYAYQFINFMLTYEVAYDNTMYVYYSTTRKDLFEDLIKEDGELYDYRESYNPVVGLNDEVYRYNATNKTLVDAAWERVRVA